MRMRRVLAPVFVGLFGWGMAAAQQPDAQPVNFHIQAQPIRLALQQFGQQAGLQVSMRLQGKAAEDIKAPAVSGELTAGQALDRMLANSGLKYEFVNDRAVRISAAVPEESTERAGGDTNKDTATSDPVPPRNPSPPSSSSRPDSSSDLEDPSARNTPDQTIGEIIVTAQKRAERLQDVPISISVLDGEELGRSRVGVAESLMQVPGMAQSDSPVNGKSLTVRGVPSSDMFAGTSTTGYYLDSVPFGFVRSGFVPDANAYDLARIEVLRGPQGTLYGATAVNGVVRVLTAEPDLQRFALKTRSIGSTTKDGGEGYRVDSAVNVPLMTDTLAARAVVSWEDRPGWIDGPTGRDINDSDNLTVRLKLKAVLGEDTSATASYWHSKSTLDGRNLSSRDRTTIITVPEIGDDEYDIYALTLEHEFAGAALKSSSSVMDYRNFSVQQIGIGAPPPAPPLTQVRIPSVFTSKVFAQEVTLTSIGSGPLRWSLGGIYRDVEDSIAQNQVRALGGPGIFPNPAGFKYQDYSESFAVFGELTWALTEHLEVLGGLRYFEDENQLRERINLLNRPLLERSAKFDKVSPRLVLSWKPSSEQTFYASYAEGFRSGFSQSPISLMAAPTLGPVGPDNLTNYEVGAKLGALGGWLNLDAAVFYIDWADVQQSLNIPLPNPAPGSPINAVGAVINGESASGLGFEFSLSARAADGLNVGVTYGQNELEFDSDVIWIAGSTPLVLAPEGSRLVNSSARTATGFLNYDFPLGSFRGDFSTSVSYVSPRLERGVLAGVVRTVESDDMWLARASAGIGSDKGWRLAVFIDNLTDFRGVARSAEAINPLAGDTRYRVRPRTVGLQVEFSL